jgi:hypothetical protein
VTPIWRNLVITVVVALIAGAFGGWLGTRGALEEDTQSLPLRQTVQEIVHRDLQLTSGQSREIDKIEHRYFQHRLELRNRVTVANRELADALMADMAFGREAQQAANHVETGFGDLQRATILYVLEVRDVLNPVQQVTYDRKVREVLTAAASPKS